MAQTKTQSGLAAMAGQMPVRNQELADQQRAARTLQLQQAIARMSPQQAPTTAQAAGMGATLAAQAGQEEVGRAQQMLETTGQMAKLGQQETALAGAEKLGAMQEAARQEQLSQVDRLAKFDANAKRELFDKELQFRKDASNQTFFSERQLADYKKQSAVSDEQYRNWANQAQNYHRRNIASLEAVYNKLAEIEKNNFQIGEQKLDQAAKKEIQGLLADAKRRVADAQRRAANNTQMWSAGMGIVGAGVGTFFGGPAGGMIGYQAGSALGGTIGSQQEAEV
jgi:hypothetical protein